MQSYKYLSIQINLIFYNFLLIFFSQLFSKIGNLGFNGLNILLNHTHIFQNIV